MRRTAIVRRSYGPPSVASRSDTEVDLLGACNGLRGWVRGADEVVSVPARTMGVVTGGPHATGLGSVLDNLLPRPLRHEWAARLRHPGGHTPAQYGPADRAVVGPRCRHTRGASAARCRRAAVTDTAHMKDTPKDGRNMPGRRMMKRYHRDHAWRRDHNSRRLSPQDSNRHLPFLFHDARVELGRSAMDC